MEFKLNRKLENECSVIKFWNCAFSLQYHWKVSYTFSCSFGCIIQLHIQLQIQPHDVSVQLTYAPFSIQSNSFSNRRLYGLKSSAICQPHAFE